MSEDTGGKVDYVLLNGFTSTAYLDAMPEGQDILVVVVRWTGEQWVQLS